MPAIALPAENTSSGKEQWSPTVITAIADTTFGETEFLAHIRLVYSAPTLSRDSIKLLKTNIVTHDGDVKVKKNDRYSDSFYKGVNELKETELIPGENSIEIECPTFFIPNGASLTLEFAIRIIV